MKRWALLLAVVGIAAWTGLGCAPAPGTGGKALAVQAADLPDMEAAVQNLLQKRLSDVALNDAPLKEALEWFSQATCINLEVKWSVLETAAITVETKVKGVNLKDVTAENALRAILDDVGGTTPLSYEPDGGYLLISTKEDLTSLRYRKIVIYDIRDLLPSSQAMIKVVREKGDGVFAGGEWESLWPSALRELCQLIARTIDRDSWMDPYGTGTVGTMMEYGGLLIVQQTWENHQKIAALLADIRRHKPTIK